LGLPVNDGPASIDAHLSVEEAGIEKCDPPHVSFRIFMRILVARSGARRAAVLARRRRGFEEEKAGR
jgi:hypothetical protein